MPPKKQTMQLVQSSRTSTTRFGENAERKAIITITKNARSALLGCSLPEQTVFKSEIGAFVATSRQAVIARVDLPANKQRELCSPCLLLALLFTG